MASRMSGRRADAVSAALLAARLAEHNISAAQRAAPFSVKRLVSEKEPWPYFPHVFFLAIIV